MFDLCGRNTKSVVKYYVSYELIGTEYTVTRIFPSELSKIYAVRILDFGFACCKERKAGERFVLVFTDADGSLEFVYCHRPTEKIILCISSALPWFACFHGLLDILWFNELHRNSRWHLLHPWLARLLSAIPSESPTDYFMCPDPFRSNQFLRFRIPHSFAPHNAKYLMEFYNALDVSLWIHIFVRLILERSVLFYSIRVTRLTSCVLAAVSLIYPLQWTHSFYPILPEKVIEVLGCPSPFVAGIHACNLEAALEHVSPGTCLVNLDSGTIGFPSSLGSSGDDSVTLTPKAVFYFLRRQLKDVLRQVSEAFNQKNPKSDEWKRVDGEACNFFEQLARPFFCLLLNLFGSYRECLFDSGGHPEVDIDLLVSSQNCTDLEPFLYSLCDTQAVQLFLDNRARDPPDPSTDAFESACHAMFIRPNKAKIRKPKPADGRPASTHPLPLAEALSMDVPFSGAEDGSAFVYVGRKHWLQSKKIRSPGELCRWDYDTNLTEVRNTHSSPNSNLVNWTQKLISHAASLKNLTKLKDSAPVDRSHSVNPSADSALLRAGSPHTGSIRPYSVPDHIPIASMRETSSNGQTVAGPDCSLIESKPQMSQSSKHSSANATANGSLATNTDYKPPRPPPPRPPFKWPPTQEELKTMEHPLSECSVPIEITQGYPRGSTIHRIPNIAHHVTRSDRGTDAKPPPLPPRPKWLLKNAGIIATLSNNPKHQVAELGTMRSPTNVLSHIPFSSPSLDIPDYQLTYSHLGQRSLSAKPVNTPFRPLSQSMEPSSIEPFQLLPASQLLVRRMNRWIDTAKSDSAQSALVPRSYSSAGDSATRSSLSRTSSESYIPPHAESRNGRSENKLGDDIPSMVERQVGSLQCLAVGDTDADLPMVSGNSDGTPPSNINRRLMRQRCATISGSRGFHMEARNKLQLQARTFSNKSWSDLRSTQV